MKEPQDIDRLRQSGYTPKPSGAGPLPEPPKGGSGVAGKPVFDPEILARAMLPKIQPGPPTPMIVLHRADDGGGFGIKLADLIAFFVKDEKTFVEGTRNGAPFTLPIQETLDVAVATYNRAIDHKAL